MRSLLAAVAIIFLTLPGAADVPRPATTDDTLDLLYESFVAAGYPDAVIDHENELVRIGDVLVHAMNIHQTLQTADNDAERQTAFDNFVSVMVSELDGQEVAILPIERILPVIRHRDFGMPPGMEELPVTDPFIGDMVLMYALDFPTHVSYLAPSDLERASLSRTDLTDIAFINFDRRGATVQVFSEPPLHVLVLDGFYEASFLARPGFWPEVEEMMGFRPAVIAPTRDLVVFADAEDPEALAALRGVRDEALEAGAYPLSEMLLVWDGEGWTVLR